MKQAQMFTTEDLPLFSGTPHQGYRKTLRPRSRRFSTHSQQVPLLPRHRDDRQSILRLLQNRPRTQEESQ